MHVFTDVMSTMLFALKYAAKRFTQNTVTAHDRATDFSTAGDNNDNNDDDDADVGGVVVS